MRPHPVSSGLVLAAAAALLLLGGCTIGEGDRPEEEPADPSPAAELRAHPYATWVPAVEEDGLARGVTRWRRADSHSGLNLFNPRNLNEAFLVDARGRTVHTWTDPTDSRGGWHHVELLPGGDLLAIQKDRHLLRIGWDGKLLWRREGRYHHDVTGANGLLHAVSRRDTRAVLRDLDVPVLDDFVEILRDDGSTIKEFSMLALFGDRAAIHRMLRFDPVRMDLPVQR